MVSTTNKRILLAVTVFFGLAFFFGYKSYKNGVTKTNKCRRLMGKKDGTDALSCIDEGDESDDSDVEMTVNTDSDVEMMDHDNKDAPTSMKRGVKKKQATEEEEGTEVLQEKVKRMIEAEKTKRIQKAWEATRLQVAVEAGRLRAEVEAIEAEEAKRLQVETEEEEEAKRLQEKVEAKRDVCSICRENVSDGEKNAKDLMKCGHGNTHHEKCIQDMYVHRGEKCPLCKKDFTAVEVAKEAIKNVNNANEAYENAQAPGHTVLYFAKALYNLEIACKEYTEAMVELAKLRKNPNRRFRI